MSLKQYIKQEVSKGNKLLQLVWDHEQESLIKVADELEKYYNIKETPEHQDLQQPTTSKAKIKETMQKNHLENWHKKTMHGYLPKKISEDKEIDHKQTLDTMLNISSTSFFTCSHVFLISSYRAPSFPGAEPLRIESKTFFISPAVNEGISLSFPFLKFITKLISSVAVPVNLVSK